ncbi:hypothetical protein INR49_011197 [Caranx melampygus]|nr:hypothetical protein INR49_011197 [Caranx melampygus]
MSCLCWMHRMPVDSCHNTFASSCVHTLPHMHPRPHTHTHTLYTAFRISDAWWELSSLLCTLISSADTHAPSPLNCSCSYLHKETKNKHRVMHGPPRPSPHLSG